MRDYLFRESVKVIICKFLLEVAFNRFVDFVIVAIEGIFARIRMSLRDVSFL